MLCCLKVGRSKYSGMITTRKPSLHSHFPGWLLAAGVLLLSIQSTGWAAPAVKTQPVSSAPSSAIDNFPPVGVETFQYSQPALQDVANTGAKYVRIEISWDQVE